MNTPAAASATVPVTTPKATPEITPEPAPEDRVGAIIKNMTLEEKVGQMLFASFRIWQDPGAEAGESSQSTNVTELNDEIRSCLEKNHFGGTILFAENFSDAEQTYRLICDLQASNQKGGGVPLFVAADQEGGGVTRIGFGTCGIGNMALAATGDAASAEEMAAIYGSELRALRLNMDLAPVVDINSDPSNPVIGVRSFSDDPETVSRFGTAFLKGLGGAGVIGVLKHFPGHGDTDTDSHTGFPLIGKTYEELNAFELIPYRTAIENGAEMIMTAHIQYPKIERETYISVSTGKKVYLPATMSKTILTDILRGDMGFEGVIVTDALGMSAISDNFTFEDALCLSINAGADMLMLPLVENAAAFRQTDGAAALIIKLVKEGRIPEERIDDAVQRILRLKEKHGILDMTDFTASREGIEAAIGIVGSGENRDKAWALAEKALTLVKNENGAFPLQDPDGTTLILFAGSCSSRTGYGKLAARMLGKDGVTVMASTKKNVKKCIEAALDAENVILISRAYNEACLDPDTAEGFSTGVFDEIIEKRHEAGKTVIVISCQLPYDAARFIEADAVMLAYCSSALREIPNESGKGSAWPPNLAAAIVSCFTGTKPAGRLPVNIPKLDSRYRLSKEILYKRG